MTQEIEIALMKEAIEEAKKSKSEDGRPHPKVGAILTDENGRVLYRSHRGEETAGGHAEFHILRKAVSQGTDLSRTTLFVTLEPCTRRGKGKTPCAVRVAESGIKRIFIGTLDPNSYITGHGEMYLSFQMEVNRFPGKLARELQQLNKQFFDQYRNNQIPVTSLYAGSPEEFRPALAGQREGILQQSMDLMAGTRGEIFIFAGDLSWLRELQIGIVLAKSAGRQIRILCDNVRKRKEDFHALTEIARRLGADVGLYDGEIPLRGTLVSPDTDEAAMMCVERNPSKHPVLFQSPHESGIIKAIATWANETWKRAEIKPLFDPEIEGLDPMDIARQLKRGIPQYSEADVTVADMKIDDLKPLCKTVERFKLFRLNQVAVLLEQRKLECARIKGSPWPIFPPVVEKLPDGRCVVIDGSHRVFSRIQRGLRTISVILVSGKISSLPAEPLNSWDEVEVKSEKLPREMRYNRFNQSEFREIRSVVSEYIKSLS